MHISARSPSGRQDCARFPLVYCLNTRPWLNEFGLRQASPLTLADVPEEDFEKWERLGFSHIWLLGVWQTGPRARAVALSRSYDEELPDWTHEDVQASPFAIADYAVADVLGGDAALAAFRARLHRHRLKLMLDFVPNHLGLDHPWVRERPELFVHLPPHSAGAFRQATSSGEFWLAHGRDPNFPPWTDTVQLDYRRAATRRAMTELLVSVAGRCDALRCDMAMLVLHDVIARVWPGEIDAVPHEEFWTGAIKAVRELYPDFLFLAEAYWGLESFLQRLGFDYTYDKVLYDRLVAQDSVGVQAHLYGVAPQSLAASAHFIENHDERRAAAVFPLKMHFAAAFLILCLPGLRLLNEGQLTGARIRSPVQLSRRVREAGNPEITQHYESLLKLLRTSQVGEGTPSLIRVSQFDSAQAAATCVVILWQVTGGEVVVCAVNLASQAVRCVAPVLSGTNNPSCVDVFTGVAPDPSAAVCREGTLRLNLPAYGTHLLRITSR